MRSFSCVILSVLLLATLQVSATPALVVRRVSRNVSPAEHERVKRNQFDPRNATPRRRAEPASNSGGCMTDDGCTSDASKPYCVKGQCAACQDGYFKNMKGQCVAACKTTTDSKQSQGGGCTCGAKSAKTSDNLSCTPCDPATEYKFINPDKSERCAKKCLTIGKLGTSGQLSTGGCICSSGYGLDSSNTSCESCKSGQSKDPDTDKCEATCSLTGQYGNEVVGGPATKCGCPGTSVRTTNGRYCAAACENPSLGTNDRINGGCMCNATSARGPSGVTCEACGPDRILYSPNGRGTTEKCVAKCKAGRQVASGGCRCAVNQQTDSSNTVCSACPNGQVSPGGINPTLKCRAP